MPDWAWILARLEVGDWVRPVTWSGSGEALGLLDPSQGRKSRLCVLPAAKPSEWAPRVDDLTARWVAVSADTVNGERP